MCANGGTELLFVSWDRPQKALLNKIKSFKNKHFKGKNVIGMQVFYCFFNYVS